MTNKTTGWMITSGILSLIVLILLVLLWNAWSDRDLGTVLEDGRRDIVIAREEMDERCRGPEATEESCSEALRELSSILEEFGRDLERAETSTTTQ